MREGKHFKFFLFTVLFLLMTAKFFSVLSLSFDVTSERYANTMIAAAIANFDISEQKFGLHILSCDSIIYDGLGKDSISTKHNLVSDGTLYLVYHSPEFANRKMEIASTRLQQYGLQGWTVYYLSRLWHMLPVKIPPQYWYFLLRALFLSTLALVLTAITFQICKAYDILFAAWFYFVCLTSVWLGNFAPNLYWAAFTWFMPMLFGLMCMNYPRARMIFCILVFISIAVKSLCGYEYLSAVMMCTIVFSLSEYLSCTKLEASRRREMLRVTLCAGLSALAGFAAVFVFHSWLLGEGDIANGLSRILYDTHALQRMGVSGEIKPFHNSITSILARYLLPPSGWIVLGLFIMSFYSAYSARKKYNINVRHDIYLLAVSLWSSLSWFVLARPHSYIHIHINHVLWVMPFIPVALYTFLKQRIEILIPDSEKRRAFFDSACSFVRRVFWLS